MRPASRRSSAARASSVPARPSLLDQSRSTTRKRPSFAFVSPSPPRRKIRRTVAPTPPASRKPAPSAPTAAAGRFERSLAPTLVASLISSRRVSAPRASCSRSDSISLRTSASVRLLLLAIALQGLPGQLCLAYGLPGDRRRPLLNFHLGKYTEDDRDREHDDGRDQ